MGLFGWLRGKKTEKPEAPRPPKVISGFDDNSPQLLVEMDGGKSVMIMDRDQYDYFYGESQAPDPAQFDLDALLPTVSRVRVLAGGASHGKAMGTEALLDVTDKAALKQLSDAFEIVEDPSTFSHCACLGGPTLELFAENRLVATIGLQHRHAIRWSKWKHDARLKDGSYLNKWLIEQGLDESFLEMLFHNHYDAGGMMPIGFCRSGPKRLSRSEQRVRLAELQRVRGGDPQDALKKCEEELQANPDLALGYAVRGLIRHQMNEHRRSIEDITQAIDRGFQEAELFFSRAVSYDTTGNPHQALKDCISALEIEPRHVHSLNSRRLVQCKLGKWNEALDDFNAAID